MSVSAQQHQPGPQTQTRGRGAPGGPTAIARIAAAVDGYPEGRDALALAASIAGVTGAELMLVTVQLDPLVPMPPEMRWKKLHSEAEKMLREARDSDAPDARILAETDLSIPRALHRVVTQHHRDLLVLGSSRAASDGRVRIGKRTRQLLGDCECALAIAPRGLHTRQPVGLRRIGVGYEGGPESAAALALAGGLAAAADAELRVIAVVDDRVPVLLRSALGGLVATAWQDGMAEEERRLRKQAETAGQTIGAHVTIDVLRGRPADALLSLSGEVDLLVIGSRRWGPAARVLLGSTGEALLHDAACPVLTIPRSAD
jgi:nucleotide-binding universal stress UspA family protein